mgnify:CR=1 FL=1
MANVLYDIFLTLHMLGIVELASPELTGEWEHKLRLMEQGKLTRDAFMAEISELARKTAPPPMPKGLKPEPASGLTPTASRGSTTPARRSRRCSTTASLEYE